MYYSPSLDISITDSVWHIVRTGARPEWHIYGISKKEYHKRMREAGFLAKEADVLRKDFKTNKLEKIVKELRILTAKVEIKCCREGEVVYIPMGKKFIVKMIVDVKISIERWKSKIIEKLTEHIKETGDEKCKNMSGSLFLCGYKISSIKIKKGDLMKIYFAHAKRDYNSNFETEVISVIKNNIGKNIINPKNIEIDNDVSIDNYRMFMDELKNYFYPIIKKCNILVAVPYSKTGRYSSAVKKEIEFAKENNIKVIHFETIEMGLK